MVEALQRHPIEKHKRPEIVRQDPKRAFSGYVIADIQRNIVQRGIFTALDGAVIKDLRLEPETVIKSLKKLLTTQVSQNRAANHARDIVQKGWVPSRSKGNNYQDQTRRAALNTLLTLCESEKSRIRKEHQDGKISDAEVRSLLEPVEGTRLVALSEVNPKKYNAIEKRILQKQQTQF